MFLNVTSRPIQPLGNTEPIGDLACSLNPGLKKKPGHRVWLFLGNNFVTCQRGRTNADAGRIEGDTVSELWNNGGYSADPRFSSLSYSPFYF